VPWQSFVPDEHAVLCFVRDGNRILLIHKRRGLGKGKVNGPGGRLEPGELAIDAAKRETMEEVGVDVFELMESATLQFSFVDGYRLLVTVFLTESYHGREITTDEAIPFWADINAIPYENMWEDDQIWLPLVLARNYVSGRFLFDGDTMLAHDVVSTSPGGT
jgi:8-oxo-dGTP diphosphatase